MPRATAAVCPPLSPLNCVAAVQTRDAAQRLLTYRWYPTTINNWDGRLLIASGQDLDQGVGCEHTLAANRFSGF